MADVQPLLAGCALGVTLNVSGTAMTGTLTGDWVTGVTNLSMESMAVHYAQAAGTATTVAITVQCLLYNDVNVYQLGGTGAAGAFTTYSVAAPDADADFIVSMGTLATAGAPISVTLSGIQAIRATAVIAAGAGVAPDNLRITFVGHPWE